MARRTPSPRPTFAATPAPLGRSGGRSAFTLVEALTVVGIVAALTAILIPTVSAARRSARLAACAASLRQWAAAAGAYAAENDGYLPRRGQGQQPTTQINRPEDWFNALPAVLKVPSFSQLVAAGRMPRAGDGGLWVCPEFPDASGPAAAPAAGYLFSYGMNMRLSTWMTPAPDKVVSVGDAGTMVFMADGPGAYCSVLPAAADYSPVARHRGGTNIAFLDGHVATFPGAYVGCGVGDPQRPDVRWIVPGGAWAGPQP